MELIKQLFHHRDWELILGGLGIEAAVVDAEAPRLVYLPDERAENGEVL